MYQRIVRPGNALAPAQGCPPASYRREMSRNVSVSTDSQNPSNVSNVLPQHRDLYFNGAWQKPAGGYLETFNPATGASLGEAAEANTADVHAAALAAHAAAAEWRKTKPAERAAALRQVARKLREHAGELALLDAANCGNPVREMASDAIVAAAQVDYYAGLITELKGSTMPMGDGVVNMTVREPYGVVARIVAYNHPLMFTAGKLAAPLAAGNTVIMKPPPQAPLSAYRLMELVDGILPPGVLNVLTGGRECGEALTSHPLIPVVTLIGSVPTGRAVARGGADLLKHIVLELGGKNALIVYPDADIDKAIEGAIRGMNFTWCGQSCGSTSRLFVHESVYDRVVAGVTAGAQTYHPGIPTEMETNMGAIISRSQCEKILDFIAFGKAEGARLTTGGNIPSDPKLANGYFIEPTIFADVSMSMRIAREEIFGPVLSILKWSDEEAMFADVNAVEYGLTAAIYTRDLGSAHRAAARVEAGFVWVNNSAAHFLGAPFGGYKQSGIGREESIDELLTFTQMKNINITL
jgi:betaine-aldehyde dehydrogenase